MGKALLLNKLQSQATKDALCQVKLKLAQWFLKKKIVFNFVSIYADKIFADWFRNYLSLDRGSLFE